MSDGISAFEDSKDYFGYLQDQEAILEADRLEEKKLDAIRDTVREYCKDPETMCEMIYAIDNEITAENMFGILCSEYVNLRDVNLALLKNFTVNVDFPERIINNIKCALLQCMLTVYNVSEIDKLKKEFLTQ